MAVPSRRAERFAAALDGQHAGETGSGTLADPETDRLTGLAHRLGALPVPGPRPAARAAALAAFAAGAAELGRHAAAPAAHAAAQTARHAAGQSARHSAGRAAGRTAGHAFGHAVTAHGLLMPVALSVSAVAVAATGVGVAAHLSLPGDPFYAVKQATESVQLHFAGGGVSGAKERLAIAHTRLAEIRDEAAFAPSELRSARITSLVASLDHDVAASSGPMLAGGGAATVVWRDAVAELGNGLAALPVNAQLPTVLLSESKLRTLWVLTGRLHQPGTTPGGTSSGGTGPGSSGGGPSGSLPTTGPSGLPSSPPSTFSSVLPAAPSTLPTALPTSLPPLPSTLPSGLPSLLPSQPPVSISVPVTLPTAVSSIIGGLLGQ